MALARFHALFPALWAGMVIAVGLMAAPAAFATLPPPDAGRVVGRLFAQEAYASLVCALLFVMIDRRAGGDRALRGETLLALGALFCTVAGYFAVQPLMAEARTGRGAMGFGVLHAVSAGFYALKGVLLLVLAWRCARVRSPGQPS